jgi:hypothetical protein
VAGREPHPQERAPLRPGLRPQDKASLNELVSRRGDLRRGIQQLGLFRLLSSKFFRLFFQKL